MLCQSEAFRLDIALHELSNTYTPAIVTLHVHVQPPHSLYLSA